MNTDLSLFDAPTKSRERNPPYTLTVDFDQYRRNREYQSKWTVAYVSFIVLIYFQYILRPASILTRSCSMPEPKTVRMAMPLWLAGLLLSPPLLWISTA